MITRLVSVSEGARLTRSIAIGTHTLTADEPEPVGADAGPTPGELLLAALGSCTSMAVRAMADRHGWRLDRVDVTVGFVSQGRIVKNVGLIGDLESAQREHLLAAAGRCPVHRLLTREVTIVTEPVSSGEPGDAPLPR
ncbi:OsmC family protein [Streptomyces sp. TLI_185]|uniref:OsmC family protein n=1 Tax=Streptomyces sp. TLI_185 TaxID=2485151 RepID=UPI000F4F36C7|nr:OsmC family protein [Streptomyces sp. TLI_185]RPF30444.1 putative redox protein [Streptomyces sp. TLI_185]